MPTPLPGATAFARPLRVAAIFIAVAALVWVIIDILFAPGISAVTWERVLMLLIAVFVAIASSPRRPVATLRWLTVGLALSIAVANLAVIVIDPAQAWASIAAQVAITLGAALFIPWSWRWQAALAGTLTVIAMATIVLWIPRTDFSWHQVGLAAATLVVASAASAIGAEIWLRERARIENSESRYRSLFESAGDAIALLDGNGVIRDANARLAELVGRPLDQLVGRPFAELHAPPPQGAPHPQGEPRTSPAHVIALGGESQHATHTLVHSDGRAIEVDAIYSRTAGAPEQFVQAVLRDLTERRALERREIKHQRADALEGLAGGIAHQFNNILGGILTHASVLREDTSDQRFVAELDEILAAARRGRDLTKELLRFTRSGPLALKPTAPGQFLESVAALARSSLPDNVTIEVRVGAGLPLVHADADHLAHACLELVLNARDAMRGLETGRLTLAAGALDLADNDPNWPAARPGRYVRIAVTDTGRGMDPATRDRVFEPFFTTKPMHRAAGLGLAMVYGVVRDHNGSIRLETEPGRGTTVYLIIPVAAETAVASPAETVPTSGPDTILIVDDEAIVRHSLKRALTRFGYRVVEAIDGPSALAELEKASPPVRLVILDLVLPGGGAGILELLRALRPDLKVLVSSGYSPEAQTVKDLLRRVEGFLPKPYEIAELRAAVSKALAG